MAATGEARVRWGLGDVAWGMVVLLLVPSAVALAIFESLGVEDLDDASIWETGLAQVPLWLALLGVPWLVSRSKGRGSLAADFGLSSRPRDVGVGLAAGFAGQVVLGLVLLPLYEALGIDDTGEAAQDLADKADAPAEVVGLVVVAVVAAAVLEELFYRGFVLRALERRFGRHVALAGSAVLFGLIHFQAPDIIALTGVGLILGWLALRYGRLGPAIWAHLAFNLTAVVSLLST